MLLSCPLLATRISNPVNSSKEAKYKHVRVNKLINTAFNNNYSTQNMN